MGESYDAVIVGGRCAGATAAIRLARGGWRVLVLDRDEAGSETLSTHGLWPNTLARLDDLGALERMRREHELNEFEHRFRVFDTELIGGWDAIGGHAKGIAPRRSVLDSALVELAEEAGAEMRFGEKVTGVIGTGTDADPIRGVVTEEGEEIVARWVIGADGRASTVASLLGLPKRDELRGEMAMLFAYWRGLPETGYMSMHAESHGVLTWGTCEDDVQLVILNCPPKAARGGREARIAAYLDGIRRFEATLDPEAIPDAEMISPIYTAPESMLRGFYRPAAGPGWALAGDACHFKHPASAQGIADAIEHGSRLGESLLSVDPELSDYERWRDERGAEHYEWSFEFARFPTEAARVLWGKVAEDAEAAQDFRGTLSRQVLPRSQFLTPERLGRWFAPADRRRREYDGAMKFGIAQFITDEGFDPATMGRMVEERGFECLLLPEHTHIPTSRETPYPAGGELPREYYRTYDPFVALATIAASTKTLRIGTGICLVVERDPITTAQEVASLDALSGGRFLFGIGAGWNEEEMRNHGTDPGVRFGLMRERVEAMKEIWTNDDARYAGKHVNFENVASWPKPAQKPHPPILIGGNAKRVPERVLRYGDEWLPNHFGDDEKFIARIEKLIRRGHEEQSREINVTVQVAPTDPSEIEAFEKGGVHRLVWYAPPRDEEKIEQALDHYAKAASEYSSAG